MAKQLNVNLAFTADTSKAKAQLQDLQKSLDQLIKAPVSASNDLNITKDLIKAKAAAADLKVALQQATTSTGSLDLSKFNSSLQKSGMTLEQYRLKLQKLGPDGSATFLKLSNSIVSAEAPLKRVNKTLEEFKTTLSNTARWQLSSSMLHGFIGALQSAYGYAKDLNESLNNIRIVTGQTTDQMAKFAEKANKAAQALSTTTTAYTDAALIFYQQGLGDKEVEERTNTVIKMANVTGDTASEVSSYMTAIWNNFDDGSESLEHYADVITALGASTASSSAEIAAGLEKFASVAETIGLSYDYSTAALATIVANTRQSADTVGTGLRTIFSRLQGLSLGETLEDGTDLNKYSKALKTVGVDILDASGKMKDMDTILTDLAGKWDSLSKAQQTALAQTVGGVRQYTNLIALMNNWGDMEENLKTAKSSRGSLQAQADIYAESWEAARDRVKSAAQAIYSDLLNDKFFISLNNKFAMLLHGIDSFIDGIGGLRTVLPGVLALITQLYGKSMAQSIDNMVFNIERQTKAYQEQEQLLRDKAYNEAMKINADSGNELGNQKTNSLQVQLELSKALRENAKDLDEQSIQELQNRIDIVKQYREQVELMAAAKDKAVQNTQTERLNLLRKANKENGGIDPLTNKTSRQALTQLQQMETVSIKAQKQFAALNKEFLKTGDLNKYREGINKIQQELHKSGFDRQTKVMTTLRQMYKSAGDGVENFGRKLSVLESEGGIATDALMDIDKVADELCVTFGWSGKETEAFRQSVRDLVAAGENLDDAIKDSAASIENFNQKLEKAKNAISTLSTTGQSLINIFQGMSQLSMGLNSLVNIFETILNPDTSGLEKFKAILMSTPMAIVGIINGVKQLTSAYKNMSGAIAAVDTIKKVAAVTGRALTEEELAETNAAKSNLIVRAALWLQQKLENSERGKAILLKMQEIAVNLGLEASMVHLLAITLAFIAAIALIAGIVYGIVKAFQAFEASTPEGKLKAAEEQAQKAKEAFNEVKNAYENLMEGFSQYKNAIKTVEDLTIGTEEWEEAINDVNTKVLELMQSYALLGQYVSMDSNGMLSISDEGMDALIEQQKTYLRNSQNSNYIQAINKNNIENENRINDAMWGPDANRAYYDSELGGDVTIQNSQISEALSAMLDLGVGILQDEESFSNAMHSIGESNNSLINALYQNKDSLIDLYNANLANTQANKVLTQKLVDNQLQDNPEYEGLSDDMKNAVIEMARQQASTDSKLYQTELNKAKQGTDKVAQLKYAELMGYTWKKDTNSGTGVYLNQAGEEITVDDEIAFALIAQTNAIAEATKDLDQYVQKMNELVSVGNQIGENVGTTLLSFSGGKKSSDLSSFNNGTITSLQGNINKGVVNGIITNEEAENNEILKYWDELGYESAQAYYNALSTSIENYKKESEKIISNIDSNTVKDAYTRLFSSDNRELENNISLAGKKSIAKALEEAFKVSGKDGLGALNTLLAQTGDKAGDVANIISTIDWTSGNGVEDLKSQLEEQNIVIDYSSSAWKNFISRMSESADSARNLINRFDKLKESLASLNSIVKDISFGSVISDEDYNTLIEYNKSLKDMFIMTAGGWKFIGDVDKLNSSIKMSTEDLSKMKGSFEEISRTAESINNTGINFSTMTNANGSSLANTDKVNLLQSWSQSSAYDSIFEQSQYSKDYVMEQANIVAAGESAEGYADALKVVNEVMQAAGEIQTNYTNGLYDSIHAEEVYVDTSVSTISQLQQAFNNNIIGQETFDNYLKVFANGTESIRELQTLLDLGLNTDNYVDNLQRLGQEYDNCEKELKELELALQSQDESLSTAKMAQLEFAIQAGEAAKEFGLEADAIEEVAKAFLDADNSLTAETAVDAAVRYMRLNSAIEDLKDNWEDYTKELKEVQTATNKIEKAQLSSSKTMQKLKSTLAGLIGTTEEYINLDLLDAINPDDILKAAQGDEEAIARIRDAFIDAQMAELGLTEQSQALKDELAGLEDGAIININNSPAIQAMIEAMVQAGMTGPEIQNRLSGIGIDCDITPFTAAMQDAILESAQAGDAIISNLGIDAEATTQDQKGDVITPISPDITEEVSVENVAGKLHIPPLFNNVVTSYPAYKKTVKVTPREPDKQEKSEAIVGVKVSNARKSSGGRVSTTNKTTPVKPPSGSKGGGGGSSSSSPPKYNEEKHKNTSDEKERYHVIKNQLEDLTSQYENISKAKDKAFGAAKLANLNKEISAQKKLTQANKEYLSEIEKYLATDKAAVKALGANIDANGTITNYDALIQKAVNEYNAAVDAFNRATTDDEGAKKAFEAAQERYDQFMETISQYEETQDLYKDQMQQVLDDIMTEQSLLLERTQLEVELKLNVSEDALNYLEYMMDNIENKAYDCAEAFGYLNGMTQEYFKTAEALEGGLRSLFANQGLTDTDFQKLIEGDTATYTKLMDMLSSGGTADLSDGLQQSEIDAAYGFTADDVDTMRDYVSQLIEANQNLQEIRQTVHEQILTVWDEWNEKLDAGIAKIEHLQSITESYQNIIDIVGQKNLGVSNAFMSKMRQQSIDQANDKLEAEKARYESLKKARDDAYAKFEEQKAKGILSPEEIKQWEDSLAQMDDDVQSASESFQSAWEDALTAANEAFEAAVDQIMQAYDDAAAGLMGSMSDLQDAFDRKSDISSQYLADYEKIYQLTKLNRDLENSIDSTSNTKAKAELLELQSKINAYEEAGIDISEYQMEQLRQEYELKKAQIELEESQEAKSQVQMTRDADGNYSYVYTANADDVAKAEQNYEDKLHQMQESNANYINDLQSNMIQMEQDYQDKVQEIMKDTSLTAEERMVKLNELNQYYDEKMKFYMSEAELWEENSQRLYEEDWMNYAAATGYKISSEEEWLDHWNETQLSILTGFGSLEEYQTNHNMNVANLLLSSSDAFATWQTNIETAMQNAGTSMADFEEDATDVLGTVAEESEKTKDSVVNMAEEATNAIGEVVNAVVDWENQYSATVQKMLAWNNALITSFNKLIAGWSAVQSSANSSGAGSGSGNDSSSGSNGSNGFNSNSGNSNSSNGGSGVDNSDKVAGVAAAIWLDRDASGWGNNPTRASRLKEKGVEGAQAYINAHGANGDIYADWANKRNQLRNYYYGSFDTGGYTGEWGLDGKFAMLHEKELVLNKDDTTHFLQAIDIVRQISELIDLNALSSAGGLSSLLAATASSSSQKLEQQVTIHAEFPNVTDKDQITEAFTDLVNLASQYANRK